jgi:hypothetical protein
LADPQSLPARGGTSVQDAEVGADVEEVHGGPGGGILGVGGAGIQGGAGKRLVVPEPDVMRMARDRISPREGGEKIRLGSGMETQVDGRGFLVPPGETDRVLLAELRGPSRPEEVRDRVSDGRREGIDRRAEGLGLAHGAPQDGVDQRFGTPRQGDRLMDGGVGRGVEKEKVGQSEPEEAPGEGIGPTVHQDGYQVIQETLVTQDREEQALQGGPVGGGETRGSVIEEVGGVGGAALPFPEQQGTGLPEAERAAGGGGQRRIRTHRRSVRRCC